MVSSVSEKDAHKLLRGDRYLQGMRELRSRQIRNESKLESCQDSIRSIHSYLEKLHEDLGQKGESGLKLEPAQSAKRPKVKASDSVFSRILNFFKPFLGNGIGSSKVVIADKINEFNSQTKYDDFEQFIEAKYPDHPNLLIDDSNFFEILDSLIDKVPGEFEPRSDKVKDFQRNIATLFLQAKIEPDSLEITLGKTEVEEWRDSLEDYFSGKKDSSIPSIEKKLNEEDFHSQAALLVFLTYLSAYHLSESGDDDLSLRQALKVRYTQLKDLYDDVNLSELPSQGGGSMELKPMELCNKLVQSLKGLSMTDGALDDTEYAALRDRSYPQVFQEVLGKVLAIVTKKEPTEEAIADTFSWLHTVSSEVQNTQVRLRAAIDHPQDDIDYLKQHLPKAIGTVIYDSLEREGRNGDEIVGFDKQKLLKLKGLMTVS